ncbi:hypothetical protein [Sphaerochaeta sp. S2]|uniref:hypothetical protein n=1 Tax=Sphaerochaeta sp. S2 TaxID=2798868 RepID=UPI0018E995A1|nr:hypothetical protein [Sphaerochaeta sp. S2]MBJ2355010.1 hypothetical protein [Sphaerochaeta sp. S2]
MKKALIPILLVLLLTLAFTSCDASLENITEFMGGFSDNVYIDSGLIEADLGAAEGVTDVTVAIGTSSGTTGTATVATSTLDASKKTISTSTFGIDIEVDVDSGDLSDGTLSIIAPQSKEEQEEYATDIAEAISSPKNLDKFKVDMAKDVTPEQKNTAKASVTVFNASITAIADDITDPDIKAAIEEMKFDPITDEDELTQGDMAVLQLMTNLVSNTVAAAKNDSGDIDDSVITEEKAMDILSEALFTAKVAEELSGISTINFSGDLIDGLMGLAGDGKATSRTADDEPGESLQGIEDSIGLDTLNTLVPKIVKVMGITGSGENHAYELKDYRSFLRKQKVYLASLNQAVAFYSEGRLSLEERKKVNVGTLVKYFLAFMTTTIDDYYQNYDVYNSESFPYESMAEAYQEFMNDNEKLSAGNLSMEKDPPDTLDIAVMKEIFGGMGDYLQSAGMQSKLENLVERIKVLVEISGFENADLNELLDELPTTIEEWFAEDEE